MAGSDGRMSDILSDQKVKFQKTEKPESWNVFPRSTKNDASLYILWKKGIRASELSESYFSGKFHKLKSARKYYVLHFLYFKYSSICLIFF